MDQAATDNVRIQRGAMVILVLHSPREKCWGLLDEIVLPEYSCAAST